MAKKMALLIIDPQVDFCDPAGALYVPGAEEDMLRLAAFIKRTGDHLGNIQVSLDSHHSLDIAHPLFWIDDKDQHPQPFTSISLADVESGTWQTTIPKLAKWSLKYLKALEDNGRYPLVVWPYHCLIGSPGHALAPPIFQALTDWERTMLTPVGYLYKGSNIYTEHYSVIQADVPDEDDPATLPNLALVRFLEQNDIVLVAGEAGSHCVANTVRDLAAAFGSSEAVKKLVLLTDTVSPVKGFENLQADFIRELCALGMQLTESTDFRPE